MNRSQLPEIVLEVDRTCNDDAIDSRNNYAPTSQHLQQQPTIPIINVHGEGESALLVRGWNSCGLSDSSSVRSRAESFRFPIPEDEEEEKEGNDDEDDDDERDIRLQLGLPVEESSQYHPNSFHSLNSSGRWASIKSGSGSIHTSASSRRSSFSTHSSEGMEGRKKSVELRQPMTAKRVRRLSLGAEGHFPGLMTSSGGDHHQPRQQPNGLRVGQASLSRSSGSFGSPSTKRATEIAPDSPLFALQLRQHAISGSGPHLMPEHYHDITSSSLYSFKIPETVLINDSRSGSDSQSLNDSGDGLGPGIKQLFGFDGVDTTRSTTSSRRNSFTNQPPLAFPMVSSASMSDSAASDGSGSIRVGSRRNSLRNAGDLECGGNALHTQSTEKDPMGLLSVGLRGSLKPTSLGPLTMSLSAVPEGESTVFKPKKPDGTPAAEEDGEKGDQKATDRLFLDAPHIGDSKLRKAVDDISGGNFLRESDGILSSIPQPWWKVWMRKTDLFLRRRILDIEHTCIKIARDTWAFYILPESKSYATWCNIMVFFKACHLIAMPIIFGWTHYFTPDQPWIGSKPFPDSWDWVLFFTFFDILVAIDAALHVCEAYRDDYGTLVTESWQVKHYRLVKEWGWLPISRLIKTILILLVIAHLDACYFWVVDNILDPPNRWIDLRGIYVAASAYPDTTAVLSSLSGVLSLSGYFSVIPVPTISTDHLSAENPAMDGTWYWNPLSGSNGQNTPLPVHYPPLFASMPSPPVETSTFNPLAPWTENFLADSQQLQQGTTPPDSPWYPEETACSCANKTRNTPSTFYVAIPSNSQGSSTFSTAVCTNVTDSSFRTTFSNQYLVSYLAALRSIVLKLRVTERTAENVYVVFEFLVGIVAYGTVFGNISSIVHMLDQSAVAVHAEERHKFELKWMDAYMKEKGLSPELQKMVKSYKELHWRRSQGLDEERMFHDIPKSLQQDIKNFLYLDMIRQVPIFQDADPHFHNLVTLRIRSMVVLDGWYVFRKGDEAEDMYFIKKGNVAILGDNDVLIVTLPTGRYFGEIALFEDCKRTATARAVGNIELCVLRKEDFNQIMRTYPAIAEKIRESIKKMKENQQKKPAPPSSSPPQGPTSTPPAEDKRPTSSETKKDTLNVAISTSAELTLERDDREKAHTPSPLNPSGRNGEENNENASASTRWSRAITKARNMTRFVTTMQDVVAGRQQRDGGVDGTKSTTDADMREQEASNTGANKN
ncbi:hypothetical protein HK102_013890 [Quaeritorhiza haematococci]|nr:hypothetical protein HK102_013890 [Quaeritorhiza haematococci]